MKIILAALVVLLLLLQYEFWFSEGGMKTVWQLNKSISAQKHINKKLEERNKKLIVEIKSLRSGHAAIEARARHDLGMIKNGEIFYQVVKP